ncbi:RhoGAP-domain-containing protein [Neocallimastix lanati (nom. inval.)]|uniref:RhoGAP-domain-containing protein n=1 Tax=Neocallimastix californiae TaxID=1754190 RepID=A0A1Y2EM38_9FUNG|nr:RhoGAP-domain-containing protein [Neocallimastix sp. JGI-2020a]ORY72633.1 RhoGAP-domain-containing protein [Neocallimastix californiae]|eukprot:ORY72633.1 RhoGAP-domain-containing protein [Neocallimastix californiae]
MSDDLFTEGNGALIKHRPISNSFNELGRKNSTAKKEHELHYLKDYINLTEYELTILKRTAFNNLKSQFQSINQTHLNSSNNYLSPTTLNNLPNSLSGSNSSVNKNEIKSISNSEKQNSNTNISITYSQQNSSVAGSLSTLAHHGHNSNPNPGKDLRESLLKNLDSISKGRNNRIWKLFSKKDKKKEVFGVPLISSLEYAFVYIDPNDNCNNKKIPIVVYECINFIKKNGMTKEGIFRVNGSERRINSCLNVFNESAGYGFGYDFEGMNVFDVASLLKLYIRQLPEPLIPFCLYNTFLDVIKYIPDTNEKVKAFQYLFMLLPSAHLILLEILLEFLSEITEYYEQNHMNSHNLACIFAPNLLRSKESTPTNTNNITFTSSDEYEIALQVVEFLIDHRSNFCITSSEVKPFQMFNKFEKETLPIDNTNTATPLINGINSISMADFSSIQFGIKNILTLRRKKADAPGTTRLSNEIKLKVTSESQEGMTSSNDDNIKEEVVDSNLTDSDSMNYMELKKTAYCGLPSPTYNDIFSVNPLNSKCKSNLENVRTHSEDSFYCVNTCPLVSTSLNRLNYLPIKNDDLYEYLVRDDDNITPTIANEIAQTPTTATINSHAHLVEPSTVTMDTNSLITKESISVSSFTTANAAPSTINDESVEIPSSSPEFPNKTYDKNFHYPSNILNLAQKNRENSIVSFLSPLSTPTQPIFSVPPPPESPPNNQTIV